MVDFFKQECTEGSELGELVADVGLHGELDKEKANRLIMLDRFVTGELVGIGLK